jgi:histidine kinase
VEAELTDAFNHSLTVALGVALGAGAIAAAAGAALVSRGVLRPLDRMRVAVRRMAAGHYDERVPEPSDRELADLAGDVNALGGALQETEQRRARLVSDLAHELRTPITSLDGFIEGLEDGVFQADAETLGAMRGESRRLLRLATDLGALSRADEQAFDLQLEAADLGAIAAQATRGLAASFTAAGVTLTLVPMPDLPVSADSDRMGQVFTNLLRNALQHIPAGGTVTLTGERRGASAAVTVTDTGEGIAPEHLGHVFDRFFRIDGSTPAPGGTGIGLTIARGITRAHGGDIDATSPGLGRGAAFTVTLPLRP